MYFKKKIKYILKNKILEIYKDIEFNLYQFFEKRTCEKSRDFLLLKENICKIELKLKKFKTMNNNKRENKCDLFAELNKLKKRINKSSQLYLTFEEDFKKINDIKIETNFNINKIKDIIDLKCNIDLKNNLIDKGDSLLLNTSLNDNLIKTNEKNTEKSNLKSNKSFLKLSTFDKSIISPIVKDEDFPNRIKSFNGITDQIICDNLEKVNEGFKKNNNLFMGKFDNDLTLNHHLYDNDIYSKNNKKKSRKILSHNVSINKIHKGQSHSKLLKSNKSILKESSTRQNSKRRKSRKNLNAFLNNNLKDNKRNQTNISGLQIDSKHLRFILKTEINKKIKRVNFRDNLFSCNILDILNSFFTKPLNNTLLLDFRMNNLDLDDDIKNQLKGLKSKNIKIYI